MAVNQLKFQKQFSHYDVTHSSSFVSQKEPGGKIYDPAKMKGRLVSDKPFEGSVKYFEPVTGAKEKPLGYLVRYVAAEKVPEKKSDKSHLTALKKIDLGKTVKSQTGIAESIKMIPQEPKLGFFLLQNKSLQRQLSKDTLRKLSKPFVADKEFFPLPPETLKGMSMIKETGVAVSKDGNWVGLNLIQANHELGGKYLQHNQKKMGLVFVEMPSGERGYVSMGQAKGLKGISSQQQTLEKMGALIRKAAPNGQFFYEGVKPAGQRFLETNLTLPRILPSGLVGTPVLF